MFLDLIFTTFGTRLTIKPYLLNKRDRNKGMWEIVILGEIYWRRAV